MIKPLTIWLMFYLVFIVVGLMMMGTAFSSNNISDLNIVSQSSIFRNPLSQATALNPVSWFGAIGAYLAAWGNVLFLASPLFPPGYPQIIRWFFLAIGAAMTAEFVRSLFGR